MSIVKSVEDTGVCRKQVTVEVPARAVDGETDKVTRKYARQVQLPGFRKGKVPREVVLKRFREEIENEVVESLVPRYWEQAREEEEIQPLGQPQLEEVGQILAGTPLTFVASVEVRPEVEIGELPELELPEPATEPTEEEVETTLDNLRRQVGEWQAVERPAARGDRVSARIEELPVRAEEAEDDEDDAAVDAAELPGAEAAEEAEEAAEAEDEGSDVVQLEVGDPDVWEELSLAVTGLSAGQEGRFTRRPEDGGGEPRTFQVKVETVEERELPPLDDELAAKIGDFGTVDELRDAVIEQLRHDKRAERDQQRREAALQQLRQRHPVAAPEGVVREEQQGMLRSYAEDLARRGIDPQQVNLDWDSMAEQIRPQAEQRVQDRLLLDALAEEQELAASDEEVAGAIGSIARSQGATVDQVRQALGGNVEGLRQQIRREKALKRLLGEDGVGAADERDVEDVEAAEDAVSDTTDTET